MKRNSGPIHSTSNLISTLAGTENIKNETKMNIVSASASQSRKKPKRLRNV